MSLQSVYEFFGISYKENATAEEILAAFEDIEPADSFVQRKDYDAMKDAFDKASSDVTKYKKEARDLRAAAKAEPSPIEIELAELKQQLQVRNFAESLMDKGFVKADATAMAESIYDADSDHVAFFDTLGKHIDSVRKTSEKQAMIDTPAPSGGSEGNSRTTPEQFKAMSVQDKQALFNSNPDAFRALSSGQSVDLSTD